MKHSIVYIFLFFAISLPANQQNYNKELLIQKNNIQMIVEISAGTNKKFEYNQITKKFDVEIIEGKERYVKYLPYIGNYGFIPFTKMDKNTGGDGDPIDVLLISENMPTGTVIDILPIAILNLLDNGEKDSKVIAIPLNVNQRILNISSYEELNDNFNSIKNIIEIWFLSYKGSNQVVFESWGDENDALIEIHKYQL